MQQHCDMWQKMGPVIRPKVITTRMKHKCIALSKAISDYNCLFFWPLCLYKYILPNWILKASLSALKKWEDSVAEGSHLWSLLWFFYGVQVLRAAMPEEAGIGGRVEALQLLCPKTEEEQLIILVTVATITNQNQNRRLINLRYLHLR